MGPVVDIQVTTERVPGCEDSKGKSRGEAGGREERKAGKEGNHQVGRISFQPSLKQYSVLHAIWWKTTLGKVAVTHL